ncbi:MAG: efflux RND transporter periplasmic adaptor subunit [Candidatus Omnitrophota bacterium]|jgi:multidrug efflux pump subunit AcrA (membrane-fusion protein)|nr:MAG: efflux RND transporter periplasmic adaptor subunit [Candidatus Omnitrophota bacterium]
MPPRRRRYIGLYDEFTDQASRFPIGFEADSIKGLLPGVELWKDNHSELELPCKRELANIVRKKGLIMSIWNHTVLNVQLPIKKGIGPLVGFFVMIGVGIVLKGCGEGGASSVPPPAARGDAIRPEVKTVKAKTVEMSWPIEIQGTCVPLFESIVNAKVSATVERIDVEEGDFVEMETTLAVMDTRELRAQREQAAANVNALEALLNKLRAGYLKEEVKQLASQLDAARATHQRLLNDVERQERLHRAGMIRDSDYEDFQTRLQVTKADVERASAAYQVALQGFRNEEIVEAEARTDAARATLELADIQMHYAAIHSPLTGQVCERYVNPGEWVSIGKPLFRIQTLNPIWVEAYVAETDIADITAGLHAAIRVQAYPERVFAGEIQVVGAALDPLTRSLPVKIRAPNVDACLRSGFFAEVTVFPQPVPSLIVPNDAIVWEGDHQIITRVREGKLERVPVRVGRRYNHIAAILAGLDVGDSVVLSDVGGVPDGTPVQVIEVDGARSGVVNDEE